MGAAATLELPEEKTRHGDSDTRLPGIFTPDFSPFRKQKPVQLHPRSPQLSALNNLPQIQHLGARFNKHPSLKR